MGKRVYSGLAILLFLVPFFISAQTPELHHVEMRDGVHLATDVYLPDSGEGPWPVVFARTPYGRKHSGTKLYPETRTALLQNGIAIVMQELRGFYESEGEAQPFVTDGWGELQDGYDTVEWILKQEWCNGKIAGTGSSAAGSTQILLAGTGPKGIAGQLIYQAPISQYDVSYPGGVFRKKLLEEWVKFINLPELLDRTRSHPYYDKSWQIQNLAERVDRVNWPVAIFASWYDVFIQDCIDLYTEIRQRGGPNARDNVFLLIGPYYHMNFDLRNGPLVGELEFPAIARVPRDLWPEDMQWWKHWLLNEPLKPVPPRVLYYVMGELPAGNGPGNEWRTASNWPPPAEMALYFLTSDSSLETVLPEQQGEFSYNYDPQNPVPTIGGNNIYLEAGPYDQRDVEDRDDVLLFTSEILTEPLEVVGRITAVLHVSTSAKDTDFTAKLTDVCPDGRSMLVCDGIRRLSLREGFTEPKEVTPGEKYIMEIDLGSTGIVFNKGHRIRLAVSGSNSPCFEPNPNTGSSDWASTAKVVAEQTVYVGGEYASHLILPVAIPDSQTP